MNAPATHLGNQSSAPKGTFGSTGAGAHMASQMEPPTPQAAGGIAESKDSQRGMPWTKSFSLNRSTYFNWLLRLVLGGMFVFAGGLKLADPAKFATAVGNYRLVPHSMIHLMAITLPGVELVAGGFLLAGIWLRAAAGVITSLTLVFAVVILSALARGLNIECGCFGTIGGKHIGLTNLAIDATLFCLAALLTWRVGGGRQQTLSQENRCAELCNTK